MQKDDEVDDAATATGMRRRAPETSVAIVGRPNAGKSSLVNRLLREERMIVSEMPGTTRDSVDAVLKWHRRQFRIVDTAGIRRAGRVHAGGTVEQVSVLLARRAIERADVVVLVIDAAQGVTDQDAAIGGDAHKAGRGIIIAANKWDLMKEQGPDAYKAFDERLRYQLKFLDYAPILHISAKTGERTPKLLEAIDASPRRGGSGLRRPISTGSSSRSPRSSRRSARAGATCVCSTPRRPAWRRRRSCCLPTWRRSCIFRTSAFSRTSCARQYGFVGTPLRIAVRKRSRERSRRPKTLSRVHILRRFVRGSATPALDALCPGMAQAKRERFSSPPTSAS